MHSVASERKILLNGSLPFFVTSYSTPKKKKFGRMPQSSVFHIIPTNSVRQTKLLVRVTELVRWSW